MKITETVERECCDRSKDFLPYKGISPSLSEHKCPRFCKHCGQIWVVKRFTDGAGDSDSDYFRLGETT